MIKWQYKIISNVGTILTSNTDFAEKKSKLGNIVFCKRMNNYYKFNH